MFEKLIDLLTRFVIAHERLATAYEHFLQDAGSAMNAVADDEIKEAVVEPPKEKKTRGKKKEEAPALEPETPAPAEEPATPEVVEAPAPEPETPAPAEEPATPEVVEAPVSHEEMKTAVKTYAAKHGREKAKALILEVGGAETLAEISDPDKVRALYLAAKEA